MRWDAKNDNARKVKRGSTDILFVNNKMLEVIDPTKWCSLVLSDSVRCLRYERYRLFSTVIVLTPFA
jgi:hypothetical protein